PQVLLRGDVARLLLVNGLQTVDSPVEPFQTLGQIAAFAADPFAEVAVTAAEIELIFEDGGEIGGQFLLDRQGLADVLFRRRTLAEIGEQVPQVVAARRLSRNSPVGSFWPPLMALEPLFCYISDILIHTGCRAVAPDLEEVMGQAHQTPFLLDLLQPAQAEAAEAAR